MASAKAIIAALLAVCSLGCGFAPNVTVTYNVPLDEEVQVYTANLCETHHIDPAIIFAMMECESQYDANAVGDYGNAIGLLQVQSRWHGERMARFGCYDLFDPCQNVTVAVDYLAELIAKYDGNVEKALVAFNAGETGAYNGWFKHGVYSSDYSRKVLTAAQKITEGAITNVRP